MIECYSENETVTRDEAIAWKNTTVKKGKTVDVSGASIQFNKCGIYEVSANVTLASSSATSSIPGDVAIQLYKNGVALPQTKQTVTAKDNTSKHSLNMTTLIQVSENNSCCPCASPTVCNLMNVGTSAVILSANLVVTKLV